ncbi:head decoration protein [Streptomyces globisporus]|uniref:head decoration protein n=1 Tax=Streptomyces globisporus TaxID=1908 RepID=UPI0036F91F58
MSIQPYTTSVTVTANRDWLASRHGTDSTESITLDLTKLTKNTHCVEPTATQPHGYIRSGVPVGRIAASGLFGARSRGKGRPRGARRPRIRRSAVHSRRHQGPGSPVFWHGTVNAAKIPGGIDPAKIAASPAGAQIRFLGTVSA